MRQLDPQGFLQKLWRPETTSFFTSSVDAVAPMLGLNTNMLRAIFSEFAAFKESGEELQGAELPPELPLVVIQHGQRVLPHGPLGDRMERQWEERQRALTENNPNSRFLIAEDSAHHIPLDQPELVVEAVRGLLERP
jgi:pimeloyl-ACP methyl ester carboxylesterase